MLLSEQHVVRPPDTHPNYQVVVLSMGLNLQVARQSSHSESSSLCRCEPPQSGCRSRQRPALNVLSVPDPHLGPSGWDRRSHHKPQPQHVCQPTPEDLKESIRRKGAVIPSKTGNEQASQARQSARSLRAKPSKVVEVSIFNVTTPRARSQTAGVGQPK